MTAVKICGICNLADAQKAVELGADYLGFIFAESPRKVELTDLRLIKKELNTQSNFVGVFRDQDYRYVNDMAEICRLDYVQLHGSESPDYCRQISRPIIKAIELCTEESFPVLSEYSVHAILFDRPKHLSKHDDWLKLIIEKYRAEICDNQPFFIAGGLNAQNVTAALSLNPYGIDVASGVEMDPRRKDHDKLEQFFQAVQGAKTC